MRSSSGGTSPFNSTYECYDPAMPVLGGRVQTALQLSTLCQVVCYAGAAPELALAAAAMRAFTSKVQPPRSMITSLPL